MMRINVCTIVICIIRFNNLFEIPSISELVIFWKFEISVKTSSSVTGVTWKLKFRLTLSSPKYVSNDGILSDSSKEVDN